MEGGVFGEADAGMELQPAAAPLAVIVVDEKREADLSCGTDARQGLPRDEELIHHAGVGERGAEGGDLHGLIGDFGEF